MRRIQQSIVSKQRLLQQLCRTEPSNAAARTLLKEVAADYKKAQKTFGGMFERGAEPLYTEDEVARAMEAEQQSALEAELGAAQRRRLARHKTREEYGIEYDKEETLSSQLPAGLYALNSDELIGLTDEEKASKLGVKPGAPQLLAEKPEFMAERHYERLVLKRDQGLTKEQIREEYQKMRFEERDRLIPRMSVEEKARIQKLLTTAEPREIELAFEEIWNAVNAREGPESLRGMDCESIESQLASLINQPDKRLEAARLVWEQHEGLTLTPLQRRRLLTVKDVESVSLNIDMLVQIASNVVAKFKNRR